MKKHEERLFKILKLADNIFPLWKTTSRKSNIIFSRTLVIKELRDAGATFERIGELLNINHATALWNYNKDISLPYLREIEKDMFNKWKSALKRVMCENEEEYAKELAKELLQILGTNHIIVSKNGKEILMEYGEEVKIKS